jgi:HEAT repeat protein
LGKIGDARAVEPLIDVLSDKGAYVSREAAEALGKIGDASAVEPLIKVLDAEHREFGRFTHRLIVEALRKLGHETE